MSPSTSQLVVVMIVPFSLLLIAATISQNEQNRDPDLEAETTTGVITVEDAEKFASVQHSDDDIDQKATSEELDRDSRPSTNEIYMASPNFDNINYMYTDEKTRFFQPSLFTSEYPDSSSARINMDGTQLEVEAKLIGVIKPPIQSREVVVFDEFIYVLSGDYDVNLGIYMLLILVFENKHPFDLLMIIPFDEEIFPYQMMSSEKANCLYIYGVNRNLREIVFKITLDDHRVTKWINLSDYDWHAPLSATDDGNLLMLTRVEGKLMGVIKPEVESRDVAVFDEFVYVLSYEDDLRLDMALILVFENKHPFDLLMIIPLEEMYYTGNLLSSKESNCLYITGYNRNQRPTIWKITLEDHRVTEWMSDFDLFGPMWVTNDGGL